MADWSHDGVIVVPCFNESRRLDTRAFRAFAQRRPQLTFLFVNDGSTDQTGRLIDQLNSIAPRSFQTLHLPGNGGKAEAVRRGMQRALDTPAKWVGFWDADLATPLNMIDVFASALARRQEIEMVFGTRLPLLGHCIRRTACRRLLGRVFASVASLVLGLRIRDTQCGAKLFRSSPITRCLFQQPFLSRWIFDVEIVARLANAGRHANSPNLSEMIYECPVDDWHEIAGGSIRAQDFRRAIVDLAAIYWQYLRPGAAAFPFHDTPCFPPVRDVIKFRSGQGRDARNGRAA